MRQWLVPCTLLLATFASTLFVGAGMEPGQHHWFDGWRFAGPLMAILIAHEFGHYFAGKIHGVDISPPYFIPAPIFLLGTMGAVIRIRSPISNRRALLDVGAAGPLAGLLVAVPVVIYGIATSPVLPNTNAEHYLIEGKSLLYLGLIYAIKGPIPQGYELWLNPTAFAGWAGLLVTMINLVPVAQLDGGHIAYALGGTKQNLWSTRIRKALPWFGLVVCAYYGIEAFAQGIRGDALLSAGLSGVSWIVWAFVLWLMTRGGGPDHPPTADLPLGTTRTVIGWFTLFLFFLLFMPAWIRQV